MRTTHIVRGLLAVCGAILIAAPGVSAQDSPAMAHLGHVATGFRGTPDGMGLLPAAVMEAETAAAHAGYAAGDPTNLEGMIRHMPHVIHALDPSVVENGPGAGYGVKAGAQGAARHISMAGSSEGAPDAISTHATHVATASSNVVEWVDEAVALAEEIQGVSDAETANELLRELIDKLDAIQNGTDANGDGRVGWQEGEGGLAQATQHLGFMQR